VRPLWLDDIESLEAISQNEDARRIFLRMAALSQTGRTENFVVEVALATANVMMGIVVDAVSEVLTITAAEIEQILDDTITDPVGPEFMAPAEY